METDAVKKWTKAVVRFESDDPETAAALIADIFRGLGMQGVIIETPDMDPDLDWAEDALPAPEHTAVIGFFPQNDREAACRGNLEESLRMVRLSSFEIDYSAIDEQDWAESWKTHFHPVKVTERIVIKPTWQPYDKKPGELIVEIDPGMAFGTGTHPTTALCIRLIERHLKPGIRFCDIGTGSGILMITAAMLGAGSVTGIDNDPVAVEVAGENLRLNRIVPDTFALLEGSLTEGLSGRFDMICANILSEVIRELVPAIPSHLSANGIFIASGIIEEKGALVTEAIKDNGLEITGVEHREGWVAVAASRPYNPDRL